MKSNILSLKKPFDFAGNAKVQLALISLICAGLLVGCNQIRKVTYPQDYVYLEKKQIRSKMALLSFYLRQLNKIQSEISVASDERQRRTLELLEKVEGLTVEFGSGVTTNHLVIDEHIDDFKADVYSAIRDVRANPPNYFAIGQLTGSCIGCHKYRD